MTTIRCDIVSAEAEIFQGEATLVVATGEMGELGIAPRHAPLITRLKPGKDFSFYATLGYRVNPAWDVYAYYDSYRFKESNTVAVPFPGGTATFIQPESRLNDYFPFVPVAEDVGAEVGQEADEAPATRRREEAAVGVRQAADDEPQRGIDGVELGGVAPVGRGVAWRCKQSP